MYVQIDVHNKTRLALISNFSKINTKESYMKTLKITEEAHKNLMSLQLKFYELTGVKYTFSEIIQKFYIESEWKKKDEQK